MITHTRDDIFAPVIDPLTGEIFGGRPRPIPRPSDVSFAVWDRAYWKRQAQRIGRTQKQIQKEARKRQRDGLRDGKSNLTVPASG
jgi:hypothetical protein